MDEVSSRQAEPLEVSCVIADDDRLTALSLAGALSLYGVRALATVHSAGDALSATLQHQPDVLIVDLDFGPGPTGLDVAKLVRRNLAEVGIVLLTSYEDPRLLAPHLPSLPIGGVFLVKHHLSDPLEVARAAKRSAAMSRARIKRVKNQGLDLTDSQIELLRLIAMGLSNSAISQRLVVTPAAVEKAISRLAQKLEIDRSHDTNLRVGLTNKYLDFIGYTRG